MSLVLAGLLTLAVPFTAAAQERSDTRPQPALIISERAIAAGLASGAAAQPIRSRDSLWNGIVVGAIIGGASAAVFGGWLCHMLREPSDPPCWQWALRTGAFGAGVGAAAGAGVDALRSQGMPIVLIRLRP